MRKLLSIILTFVALAPCVTAQKRADRGTTLRSLVAAELAFAAASVARGTRAAFIENLADDSVLFRPRAVSGKKWMEEHPARGGVLTWRPIFADASEAGDMGYTTGPWEFREKSLEEKPVAYGHFLTVWKRQQDGAWKAVIDLGVSHAQPETNLTKVTSPADGRSDRKQKPSTDANAELLRTEEEFSKAVAVKKTTEAFLSYLADDARVYRMESFPAVGKKSARALLAGRSAALSWQPARADVSASGDLGYTYGTYESQSNDGKAESGNYVRIWKKLKGKWRVVADVLNPVPPARAS